MPLTKGPRVHPFADGDVHAKLHLNVIQDLQPVFWSSPLPAQHVECTRHGHVTRLKPGGVRSNKESMTCAQVAGLVRSRAAFPGHGLLGTAACFKVCHP